MLPMVIRPPAMDSGSLRAQIISSGVSQDLTKVTREASRLCIPFLMLANARHFTGVSRKISQRMK
jgi:hypothetical protein